MNRKPHQMGFEVVKAFRYMDKIFTSHSRPKLEHASPDWFSLLRKHTEVLETVLR